MYTLYQNRYDNRQLNLRENIEDFGVKRCKEEQIGSLTQL